ncbi:UDP-glucose 4-epimerase GalE [Roseibium aestuarii]|uniref:UDP-glucose 4-epimerase n=1 Tax=Roseibium aestuarii TaxID=2600299 RepID=A0ABW4JSF4_9HYPH|nr:UDP-glucose 4-epimerase GalE [Roseibium aestuarii]
MTILITGGAGYIGSHACVTFLEAGHDVVVVDNLANAREESLRRVARITGKSLAFEQADIRDGAAMERILRDHGCTAVVHFAGLKVVGESLRDPLAYYDVNVTGTQRLLSAMERAGVHQLIFSSSANIYGPPQILPVPESHPAAPMSPYGRTKRIAEHLLNDLSASDPKWRFAILRYFNPVGAHESGLIGENPLDVPQNLCPFIAQVASGRREKLMVYGNDYETRDGTGLRDYIHVVDLVEGHLKAYEALQTGADATRCFTVNLGTGTGYTVLEMVRAFERATNRPIPFEIAPRRDGDVGECYAETQKAADLIDWRARFGLDDMCRDAWNWVCKNPTGFED